jgi:hypothetical protein
MYIYIYGWSILYARLNRYCGRILRREKQVERGCMLKYGSILTGWICVKHKITLETCCYKIPGIILSGVLTSHIRRDRIMSKTLNLFIISNSEISTKSCLLFHQQSAHCICCFCVYQSCFCVYQSCFCMLENFSKISVGVSVWVREGLGFHSFSFFLTLLYMIFLWYINNKSTSNFALKRNTPWLIRDTENTTEIVPVARKGTC